MVVFCVITRSQGKKKVASRHQRIVTFDEMRSIAYDGSWHNEETARNFAISKPWVQAIAVFVASAYLRFQYHLLGLLLAKAAEVQPDLSMTRLKWDETGERLTLQQANMTGEQQSCVYQVAETETETETEAETETSYRDRDRNRDKGRDRDRDR